MKLNIGAGPHYADEWLNTDYVSMPELGITPDVVVDPADPLPFGAKSATAAYCGHCLEHMAWEDVPEFLAKLAYVLVDDAPVMFVGPDVERAIENYADGVATFHDIAIAMEGSGPYTEATGFAPTTRWDADRHRWNCSEQRVHDLLVRLKWRNVRWWPVDGEGLLPELPDWPLVSRARNQFAVSATIPARR
jgi:hypothetical protein